MAPEERFTENYVAWNYRDSFRVIGEAIHDTAAVESIQTSGKLRPARVAVVTGKVTDFHESRLMMPKNQDPFARRSKSSMKRGSAHP